MQQSKTKSLAKWLKNILPIAILAFLLWYLSRHWDQLKGLINLNPDQLISAYGTWFFSLIGSAYVTRLVASAMNAKCGFWEMVKLNNAALLLNYTPMKFGTLFRAGYLKKHCGLSFTGFATFFVYVSLLMLLTSCLTGFIVLVWVYGFDDHRTRILALIMAAGVAASSVILWAPLPKPSRSGRIWDMLRNYLTNHKKITGSPRLVLISVVILTVNFLLESARIGIIYHSMGKDLHPGGYVVLGALSSVVFFVSPTPGALGIKEAVLSFSAVVLGVPLEVAVLAALLERAVTLSYAFVAGGICSLMFWFKSPDDFEKQQLDLNT